jgi:lysophospholipid acyltransferase (LPLAT)-like uncharacterized protein
VRGESGRALVGRLLGFLARAWLATLRVRLHVDPALASVAGRPWVFAFWHGTQWPLLAWRRRRRTAVLVSWSPDGAMQSGALAVQGFSVVRGSSSRGGARGLIGLVRAMRRDGADAAFAVDGPRGPRGVVKEGAVLAARASGGVLVPMGGAVRRGVVLRRAWDRFAIAWPFSTVAVVLGAPIEAVEAASGRDISADLGAALELANDAARALLLDAAAGAALSPEEGDRVDLDLRAAR